MLHQPMRGPEFGKSDTRSINIELTPPCADFRYLHQTTGLTNLGAKELEGFRKLINAAP